MTYSMVHDGRGKEITKIYKITVSEEKNGANI